MALINDLVGARDGGAHRHVVPANTDGVYVFGVSRGRRYALAIGNPGGSTIDLIHYNFTAADDASDKATRLKVVDETGLVALQISRFTAIGVAEIGIEITTDTASPVTLELVECKL